MSSWKTENGHQSYSTLKTLKDLQPSSIQEVSTRLLYGGFSPQREWVCPEEECAAVAMATAEMTAAGADAGLQREQQAERQLLA